MTTATVPTIEQPSYFRNAINEGAADISRGYLLKHGTAYQGVGLSTATSDSPAGVSVETMEGTTAGAKTRSAQIGGQAMCIAGAAVTIGDLITTDSSGRGIPATDRSQSVWGRAATAQSTVNGQFSLDLDQAILNASGGLQSVQMTIDHTNLTTAGTAQSFALVTLPANTWVLGYQLIETEKFTDGSTGAFNLDVGYTGAEDTYLSNADIDNNTPQTWEAAISKLTTASRAVLVRVQADVNVNTATAGNCVLKLLYMTSTPLVVAPA